MVRRIMDPKSRAILFLLLTLFAAILGLALLIGLAAIVVRISFVLFAVLVAALWIRNYLHRRRR
jgi:hypothetical protein